MGCSSDQTVYVPVMSLRSSEIYHLTTRCEGISCQMFPSPRRDLRYLSSERFRQLSKSHVALVSLWAAEAQERIGHLCKHNQSMQDSCKIIQIRSNRNCRDTLPSLGCFWIERWSSRHIGEFALETALWLSFYYFLVCHCMSLICSDT